jgi:hypothetical protein
LFEDARNLRKKALLSLFKFLTSSKETLKLLKEAKNKNTLKNVKN